MPYVTMLNDNGDELDLPRFDLSNTVFKMSPPRHQGDAYTLLNISQIVMGPSKMGGMASRIAVCHDVDDVPFVDVPMEHAHQLREGDGLVIGPGMLVIDMHDIRPGRKRGEPLPPDPREAIRKIFEICNVSFETKMDDWGTMLLDIQALCEPFVGGIKIREEI